MPRTKTREAEPALFNEPVTAPAAKLPAKAKKTEKPKGTAVSTEVRHLPPTDLLAAVVRASADPNCNAEKMHSLLDARKRLMAEMAEVGFRRAYRAAKREMPRISKDNRITIEKGGRVIQSTPYATYENINMTIEPILDRHGLDLSLHSEPKPSGEGVVMRATLSFIAETPYGEIVHSESSLVPMPPDPTGSKNAAQAVSSALAYAKRNAVILVLNIISEAPQDRDLDGHEPGKVKKGAKPAEAEAAEPDKPKTINGSQAKELLKAINDCGVGPATFLVKYEIDAVHMLPADLFDVAMKACKDYGERTKNARRGG